jgi:hypothetical protein
MPEKIPIITGVAIIIGIPTAQSPKIKVINGKKQIKKKEFKKKTMIDPNVCLFFIDEGWMVPKHMVKDILSFGVKVIVCGDFRQLPPVGDDPGFLTGPNVRYLTEKEAEARKAKRYNSDNISELSDLGIPIL